MQLMTSVQSWIHRLENTGMARYVTFLVGALLFAVLVIRYDVHCARNMASPTAMDAAQLGHNLARGRGYTTECIRPLSIYLIKEKNHAAGDKDPARLNGNHPDISNAPAYPVVLAGLMKVLPFHLRHGPERHVLERSGFKVAGWSPERALSAGFSDYVFQSIPVHCGAGPGFSLGAPVV